MNEIAIKKNEAIALLKMGIEFGVDEAISAKPRNRLAEEPSKTLSAKTNLQLPVQKDPNSQVHIGLQKKSIDRGDENILAAQCASECGSVTEITRAINDFPYFKKDTKEDNIEFYQGATKPSIVIFKEPEIYNIQSQNEPSSCDKKLLYQRIVNSIEITLSGETGGVCGSVVTFPLCFDKSEANEHFNIQLMRPFLLQYISVLKPKVLIGMGGFKLDDYNILDKNCTNLELLKELMLIDFPSLDVLVRAPKRKKDVWKQILELKKNYNGKKV